MANQVNGLSTLQSLPPNVRGWAGLIATVGIPGVIALGAVYVLLKTLPEIRDAQMMLRVEQQHHQEEMARSTATQEALLQRILITQQIICSQGETSLEGKRRCFGN